MNSAILLTSVLALGAPALKDPPTKRDGIVGEWIAESVSIAGQPKKAPPRALRYEFTADGKWIFRVEGIKASSPPSDYKVDTKASPATIDVVYPPPPAGAPQPVGGPGSPGMLGIYTIEGDTLTICFAREGERPRTFNTKDGARAWVIVLKRAKK